MSPDARNAWFRTLGQLALVLAAGLLVGLLLGQPWPTLTVAALGVVAWHYWKLRHVLLRLTARQRLEQPQGVGVWNELDRLLFRSQSEMRARKRRLHVQHALAIGTLVEQRPHRVRAVEGAEDRAVGRIGRHLRRERRQAGWLASRRLPVWCGQQPCAKPAGTQRGVRAVSRGGRSLSRSP